MTDRQALTVARFTAVAATLVGIIMVPVFMNFDSIYDAHGAFTAAVTPPLVVTFVFSLFWKRFTSKAALATMIVGLVAVAASFFIPELITPFAHGVPMGDAGDGLFAGVKQYKFMRACYGLSVCTLVGVIVTFLTKPETDKDLRGLIWQKGYYRSLNID
jgi:SSS family solute:Na+ symporter